MVFRDNGATTRIMYAIDTIGAIYNTPIVTGKYYHVAATKSADSTYLYIDGVFVAKSKSSVLNIVNTKILMLGYGLRGAVSNVSIWNKQLSAQDIKSIYENKGAIELVTSGLLEYWLLLGRETSNIGTTGTYGLKRNYKLVGAGNEKYKGFPVKPLLIMP